MTALQDFAARIHDLADVRNADPKEHKRQLAQIRVECDRVTMREQVPLTDSEVWGCDLTAGGIEIVPPKPVDRG